ncbi:hypothetical protein D3C75_915500 [compost metagenome]
MSLSAINFRLLNGAISLSISSNPPASAPIKMSLARMVNVLFSLSGSNDSLGAIKAVACSMMSPSCRFSSSARGVGTRFLPALTIMGSSNCWRIRPRMRLIAGALRFIFSAAPLTLPSSSSRLSA